MRKPKVSRIEKRRTLLQYLLTEPVFFVLCDARRSKKKIIVPPPLRGQPSVVFQLGTAVEVEDLNVTYGGWSALLDFKEGAYWCHIPWDAIFGLCRPDGDRCVLWEPPTDVVTVEDAAAERRKTLPPYLRVIEGGRSDRRAG